MAEDLSRAMLGAVLMLAGCKSEQPVPPQAPPPAPAVVKVEAPVRRGVEARRADFLGPFHGVELSSSGLVDELFLITADFDAKEIMRVVTFMKDGSKQKTFRTLTDEEVTELTSLREKTWAEWTELEHHPSAEYQERLYLLDGQALTHIKADNGFRETGVAGVLAQRLQSLAKKQ